MLLFMKAFREGVRSAMPKRQAAYGRTRRTFAGHFDWARASTYLNPDNPKIRSPAWHSGYREQRDASPPRPGGYPQCISSVGCPK